MASERTGRLDVDSGSRSEKRFDVSSLEEHLPGQQKVPATTAVRAPSPAYSWSSGEANFGDLPDDWYDADKYLRLQMEERRAKTAAASQDGAGPFALVASAPPMEDDGHRRATQGPGAVVIGTPPPTATNTLGPGGKGGLPANDGGRQLRRGGGKMRSKKRARTAVPPVKVALDNTSGPSIRGLETKGPPGHQKVTAAVPATTAVRAPSPAYSWSSGEANFGALPDDWYDADKYLRLQMEERRAKTAAAPQDGAGPFALVASAPPMEDDGHRRAIQGLGAAVTGTLTPMAPGGVVVVAEDDEAELLRHCDEETRRLIRAGGAISSSATEILDDAGGPDFYGLGSEVRRTLYGIFRISRLHSWQRDVLDKHLVHEDGVGMNGLIVAPTSGGKTMVAIVLALHCLLVRRQDAIMVMPFVAIVQEKVGQLQRLAARLATDSTPTFAVAEYAGTKGRLPLPSRRAAPTIAAAVNTIYVCTMEKANIVWRHITKEPPPFHVGALIVDEFQMMGDKSRGGICEELVSGVLFWSGASTRVVGLSATVGNQNQLATYLGGGDPAGCHLHHVRRPENDRQRVREFVVVLGGAFPVRRHPTDETGSVCFDQQDGDGAFDVVGALGHHIPASVQGDADEEDHVLLWLRTHQLRLSIQGTALIKLPHRSGSVRIRFPAVDNVPAAVREYCSRIKQLHPAGGAAVRSQGLDLNFVESMSGGDAAAATSTTTAAGGQPEMNRCAAVPPGPYVGQAARFRNTDAATWDMRVISELVVDAVLRGRSVIVFCPSRPASVATCKALTRVCKFMSCTSKDWPTPSKFVADERRDIVAHLTEESGSAVDCDLLRAVEYGVGYHTAALTSVEREVVEDAFANHVLNVLCCTSTLAAGVNLPADRIIIRSPWTGGDFLTCTRYLQMIGRAGRTGLSMHEPDSYVLIAPGDAGRFQSLVECHVEDVHSILALTPPYYQMAKHVQRTHLDSCLTRFIIGVVTTAEITLLSTLVDAYRCTLLYQVGGKLPSAVDDGGDEADIRNSLQPLLTELRELVSAKHLRVLVRDTVVGTGVGLSQYHATVRLLPRHQLDRGEHRLETRRPLVDRRPWGPEDDAQSDHHTTHRCASEEEAACFVTLLDEAAVAVGAHAKESVLPDVAMSVTTFAKAADLATIALHDATRFVEDARAAERGMLLQNPLYLLFLSMDPLMCRSLGEDDAMRINNELANNFAQHGDAHTMRALGIEEQHLEQWLCGQRLRGNADFNAKLARLWGAMIVKEIFVQPHLFDQLCLRFGYTQTMATELTTTTANRCSQLRNFCEALGSDIWWYPPLAKTVVRRITDACAEELRPLIAIRHVTKGRAVKLLGMGVRDVAAVAAIFPPDRLLEAMPNLGRWRAYDMVLHARTIVRHEAIQLAAQSQDRYNLLTRRNRCPD